MAVSVLLGSGCLAQRVSGHFGANAYYHAYDHYRVRYSDEEAAAAGRLLPEPWQLLNFELDDAGRPGQHSQEASSLSSYELARYLPRHPSRLLQTARHDLRFQRPGDGSEIFVRTIPLRDPWTLDSVPVLLRRTVASMSVWSADAPDLLGRPVDGRLPTIQVAQEGPARVDGRDAYFITFDRVVSSAGAPAERVTLVALQTRRSVRYQRRVELPSVLVFGYLTHAGAEAEVRRDFRDLVARVDLAEPF